MSFSCASRSLSEQSYLSYRGFKYSKAPHTFVKVAPVAVGAVLSQKMGWG
jgi:hypothetical protein